MSRRSVKHGPHTETNTKGPRRKRNHGVATNVGDPLTKTVSRKPPKAGGGK